MLAISKLNLCCLTCVPEHWFILPCLNLRDFKGGLAGVYVLVREVGIVMLWFKNSTADKLDSGRHVISDGLPRKHRKQPSLFPGYR